MEIISDVLSAWALGLAQLWLVIAIFDTLKTKSRLTGETSALIAVTFTLLGTLAAVMWLLFAGIPLLIAKILCTLAIVWIVYRVGSFSKATVLRAFSNVKRKHVFFYSLLLIPHLLINLVKPEFSVDGALYHGPTLVNLLGSSGLWNWMEPNQYIYYSDSSMIQAAIQARLTAIPMLDDGSQIPFLLIMALSIQVILSNSKLNSKVIPIVVLALLTAPVIWLQPRIMYVDLAYASAIVSTIAISFSILRSTSRNSWTNLALAFALGSVLSIKPTGTLSSIIIAFVVGVILSVAWRSKDKWYLSIFWPAFGLVLGSAFYLRNLVEFGNPIFPVRVSLVGHQFPGVVDSAVFGLDKTNFLDRFQGFVNSILDGLFTGPSKLDYDPRSGGFGFSGWILVLFAILTLIGITRLREISKIHKIESLVLVAVGTLLFMIQPMANDTRYVIASFILITAGFTNIILEQIKKFQEPLAWALVFLSCINVFTIETKFIMGTASILNLLQTNQIYQPSTPGNLRGVGSEMSWLDQGSRQNIFIQSEGGVSDSGLVEKTKLMQQSYALFGTCLCNRVVFSKGPLDPTNGTNGYFKRDVVGKFKYVLIYNDSEKSYEDVLSDYHKIAEIEPIEGYFSQGYSVFLRNSSAKLDSSKSAGYVNRTL